MAHPRGERHHNSTISDDEVKRMRFYHRLGMGPKQIADVTGRGIGTVRKIIYNQRRQETTGERTTFEIDDDEETDHEEGT